MLNVLQPIVRQLVVDPLQQITSIESAEKDVCDSFVIRFSAGPRLTKPPNQPFWFRF